VKWSTKLEEYFNLRVELPEAFGTSVYFALRTWLKLPDTDNLLEARIESVPTGPDSSVDRFKAEWRYRSVDIRSNDPDLLRTRLDQAHASVLDCFRASMTEKTWELFLPQLDE
jgi:hypothetical protein